MKRTDHILILTRALLTASAKQFDTSLVIAGNAYVLNENRKGGVVSLGAETIRGEEESYVHWINQLREEHVNAVTFSYEAYAAHELRSHQAAAFAGIPDLLMQVTTTKQKRTYSLRSFLSPRYEITLEQFIALVESQQQREALWSRVGEMVLASNKINNRTVFNITETQAYLRTPEAQQVLEFLGSDMLKETQVECTLLNIPFTLPESLAHLFTKPSVSPYFSIDQKEYVYLYPLKQITATHVLTLISSQSFPPFWESLNEYIKRSDDASATIFSADAWPDQLHAMDDESLQNITYSICRTICERCEATFVKPVIPVALSEYFGPSEAEQRRAAARSKGEHAFWMLQPAQHPWEYYAFHELETTEREHDYRVTERSEKFLKALAAAQTFAAKNNSPFEEAFSLSIFLLTKLPEGAFDEAHVTLIKDRFRTAGFSDQAINVFENRHWVGAFLTSLHFTHQEILGLLAIQTADVFGGMGSWNDQYFEGDQQQVFEIVSAELFDHLKRYFTSLLSRTT